MYFLRRIIMTKRVLFVMCFVLAVGVCSPARAGTAIDVNNFSMEFDANGDQIYCHTGSQLAWQVDGGAWVGVDPYCLGDTDYDPCAIPENICYSWQCYTDNHDGCHCWPATHGICYCYVQATSASQPTFLYQNLDMNNSDANAVVAVGRKYILTWDSMSEIYRGTIDYIYSVGYIYYGDGGGTHTIVAEKAYLLPVWIGDLNEWEHEWEPNLTCTWVATEGHPAIGQTLGLKWHSPNPSGSVRAYTFTENVRFEWVWATDAFDPNPGDGAQDVARDVNLAWSAGLWADRHIVYFDTDYDNVATMHEDANQGIQDPCTFDPTPSGGQLDLGRTYYWRVVEVNSGFVNPGGGVPDPPWNGDVWSFTVTGYAANPSPFDGERNVPFVGTTLSWTPGTDSNSHDVYFGTDDSAVASATTSSAEYKTNTNVNSYNPGAMLFGQKYYWRIDEVNEAEGTLVKGNVWSFTVAEYYTVEEFEAYNNDPELYAVWKDYWVNGTGANVYMETDVNYTEDGNSMQYDYDDSTPPYYSEAYADISTLGISGNWTQSGLEVLCLSFLGKKGNALDDMYVALTDGSNVTGKVLYPDVNEVGIGWTGYREWNIELQDFVDDNSVDITDVSRITIGFGDKSASGTGTAWFDSIRLYPPRCRPEMAFGQGSFDWDPACEVGIEDLTLLAERDWLMSATGNVTASPPDANLLTGWWRFEENSKAPADKTFVADSSGNGNDGELLDPDATPGLGTYYHHDPCCVEGTGSFTFDGYDDYVNLPALNLDSNTVTMSTWVKRDGEQTMYAGFFYCFYDPNDPCEPNAPGTGAGIGLGSGGTYGFMDWEPWEINHELCYFWSADMAEYPEEWTWDWHTGLVVPDDEWVMAALVVAPTKASIYMYDGELQVATNYTTHYAELFNGPSHIGEQMQHEGRFFKGNIDDVRIYSYSLTPAEVLYMGLQGPGSQYVGLPSWRTDADDDDTVNFKDFGIMADNWLAEVMWP
jgi:hypothetical protein